jgi:hypothetical protein
LNELFHEVLGMKLLWLELLFCVVSLCVGCAPWDAKGQTPDYAADVAAEAAALSLGEPQFQSPRTTAEAADKQQQISHGSTQMNTDRSKDGNATLALSASVASVSSVAASSASSAVKKGGPLRRAIGGCSGGQCGSSRRGFARRGIFGRRR